MREVILEEITKKYVVITAHEDPNSKEDPGVQPRMTLQPAGGHAETKVKGERPSISQDAAHEHSLAILLLALLQHRY